MHTSRSTRLASNWQKNTSGTLCWKSKKKTTVICQKLLKFWPEFSYHSTTILRETGPTHLQSIGDQISPWVPQLGQILNPLRDTHPHKSLNQRALATCTGDPLYMKFAVRMTALNNVHNRRTSAKHCILQQILEQVNYTLHLLFSCCIGSSRIFYGGSLRIIQEKHECLLFKEAYVRSLKCPFSFPYSLQSFLHLKLSKTMNSQY